MRAPSIDDLLSMPRWTAGMRPQTGAENRGGENRGDGACMPGRRRPQCADPAAGRHPREKLKLLILRLYFFSLRRTRLAPDLRALSAFLRRSVMARELKATGSLNPARRAGT